MDERPRHGEGWKPVPLRGAEQLLKRRVRRAAAKADQDAESGIEYSAALHVERELGRSPLSRHAFLTSCAAISECPSPTWRRTTVMICVRPTGDQTPAH